MAAVFKRFDKKASGVLDYDRFADWILRRCARNGGSGRLCLSHRVAPLDDNVAVAVGNPSFCVRLTLLLYRWLLKSGLLLKSDDAIVRYVWFQLVSTARSVVAVFSLFFIVKA